eukprot:c25998_g1_i1.p1 GENE.c25998_g1_i1~~c25998_g1_i1.p1  ORF type:complete len:169 (+),score=23.96 c25998_g1_i1:80-586(+)
MIIYRDRISHDEVCSDAFPMKEVEDGMILEFEGKKITLGPVKVDTGANASAEEEEEGTDDQSQTVINIVHSCNLCETGFDKKGFLAYIKTYMKDLKAVLEKDKPDRVDAFMKGAQPVVKKILENFGEYTFYTGESMNAEGMMVLMYYKEGEEIPRFWIWKDGVRTEKV